MSDHPLAHDVVKPSLGAEVELFIVDARAITGDSDQVAYFCSSAQSAAAVRWKNIAAHEGEAGAGWVDYLPVPIEASGFEATAEGTLPHPKFAISNIGASGALAGVLFSLVYSYQDMLGATLIRFKTLGKYLGGESLADYDAHWPPDVYTFNRKTAHDALHIEWELAPDYDASGIQLPRRLVLRDVCQHRYRTYSGSGYAFTYDNTENACPIANRVLLRADGLFLTTDGWNQTGGEGDWSIAGQTAIHTPGTGHTSILYAPTYSLRSESYAMWVTVIERTAGSMTVKLAKNGVDGSYVVIDTNAAHYFSLIAPYLQDDSELCFVPTADFNGKISLVVMEFFLDQYNGHTGYIDTCNHSLEACRRRWPSQALPFSGFPGVARVRV